MQDDPKSRNEEPTLGRHRAVTVIGAGFSGLVSAFYLSRAGFQVEVIEKSNRVGGLIGTLETPFGLVETGANALLNSARVEELFGLLGLKLQQTQKIARKRFIFRNGHPTRWPLGIAASLRVGLFIFKYTFFKQSVRPKEFETIRNFGERVLGREASQYLLEAALQGIYAGDPARLSASLIFSGLFASRANKQLPGKFRGSVSAEHGMGQLMEKLHEKLSDFGVRFRFEQELLPPASSSGNPIVIAVSAWQAAELLASVDPVRAEALSKIEALPIVTATIAFKEPPPKTRGFGCLFPPVESRKALGVLMNNYIFAGRTTRGFSETWIFGGARSPGSTIMDRTDQEIVTMAGDERNESLKAASDYHSYRITRWPKALPHYTGELEKALPELRGLRQNAVLIGNYLYGIGLTKILEAAARLPEEIQRRGEWKA